MKYIYSLIISLTIIFSSCKKEKLDADTVKFVGKWKFTSIAYKNGNNINFTDYAFVEISENGRVEYNNEGEDVEEKGRITDIVFLTGRIYMWPPTCILQNITLKFIHV